MARVLPLSSASRIRAVWSSMERKAWEGAEILAAQLDLPVTQFAELGENDRSATGYLPSAEFEAVADQFFAAPEQSVRGWERAVDAQRRIIAAVEHVLAVSSGCGGDVAVVSHGGVGTLLLCHLCGCAIGRERDQPSNNGGNHFAFDTATRQVFHGWQSPGEAVSDR